ncbi:hypothetical protein EZ428_18665 [Pedobacter frigiditerrae]|uniref:Uncharacterized protein n=1 Tax=Pedobacter frigiditerrae TaxID=2530452 RepID=A0A4R0MP99_9SPHI|nr:hypothetical protein [Pedobacter frigiditerrae]TCC88661.1 hypothetical protein EZ428_18665 [Pedobacter frigiditerrae]
MIPLDNMTLTSTFNKCFEECLDNDRQQKRADMEKKFTDKIPNDHNLSDLEKIIKMAYVFKKDKGYAREMFFNICMNEDYLSRELLTKLYVSVHTMANPFRFFTSDGMAEVFSKINMPFTCFESLDKLDKLPDRLEIFRGLREDTIDLDNCGFCWSLNEATATRFATAEHTIAGYVVSGWVTKSDIYGYVTSRDEDEIIITAKLVKDKIVKPVL